MTTGELVDLLKKYPPEALIVFEDATTTEQEDEMSYEAFETEFNADGEVVLRLI